MKSLPRSKYHKADDENNEDDEDDRKPPPRILFVTPSPATTPRCRRNKNANELSNDGEQQSFDASTLDNQGTATTASPAGSSTVMTTPTCSPSVPVIQRQNTHSKHNSSTKQLVHYHSGDESSSECSKQQQHQPDSTLGRRRRVLVEELFLLFGTAVLSLGTFLYVMLPTTALAALGLFLSSLALTFYTLQQAAVQEIQTAVRTTGLGQYLLPTWLYDMLTQQSLHEFMSDPTFALEYRHLLLYFLPGISEEQLHAYLQQLAPRHVQTLYRPGLGHLLGPSFMRVLVGEQRMLRNQQQLQQQPIHNHDTVGLPLPAQPRLLLNNSNTEAAETDDESASTTDMSSTFSESQAIRMARSLGLVPPATTTTSMTAMATPPRNTTVATPPPRRPPIPSNLQDAYNQEERVLTNAISDTAYSAVWQPAVSYMAYFLRRFARPVTERIIWYGFGVSLVSSSVGLMGQYAPVWLGLSSRLALPVVSISGGRSRILRLPSRREDSMAHTIWTTALLSGATAVVTLGLQHWYLYSRDEDQKDDSSKKKAVPKKDSDYPH